jgi:tetratricopeptide (TPR) repeat protein
MDGKNACWVPGTDHASIATENKVVQKLAAEGIKKEDLTREQFLEHAWEWKEKHGGIILGQLRKLGASCDWDRTKFTMDPELSDAVINTFVHFYNKGYIYLVYFGDNDKALECFDQVLQINPNSVNALFNKGRTYEQMGDFINAKSIYLQILRNYPDYQLAIDAVNRISE